MIKQIILFGLIIIVSFGGIGKTFAAPRAVATFESVSLYWKDASGGSTSNKCSVKYRIKGNAKWNQGYPLWFDKRNDEYRGSLVNLIPNTTYEIELKLSSGTSDSVDIKTWNENFPIAKTVELSETSHDTLIISESGSPNGYILYTHPSNKNAVIDTVKKKHSNIEINGSYVIVRGLTLKNAMEDSILLGNNVHDVVIEKNDISGWGRVSDNGFGINYDSAISANYNSRKIGNIKRIIVQRNKMHDPTYGSNSWALRHPSGPQVIHLISSAGNHVFRYNKIFSGSENKYFNDPLGAAANFSDVGFPHRDTDIYGNYISNCWDDGIESEGGNINVRIWGNYITDCFVGIGSGSTSKGPLYIWRNITGRSAVYPRNGSGYGGHGGGFLKTDENGDYKGGKIYVFHNTILQPVEKNKEVGQDMGLGWGGPMKNVTSRNNIFHVRGGVSIHRGQGGSYDYDLYNGSIPSTSELHGIHDKPIYASNNVEGVHALDSDSPGYDDGVILPNFSDGYTGAGPDMGAQEAGAPKLEFGVDAYLSSSVVRCGDGVCNGGESCSSCSDDCGACSVVIRADVNQDSEITTTDALLVLRKSTDYLLTSLEEMGWHTSTTTGDVNCDGEVRLNDAVLLLKKAVGGYSQGELEGMGWCEGNE